MGLPPCGTDMAHHALASASPAYLANKTAFDASWYQDATLAVSDSLEVYTLPLVVHVIHRGAAIGVEENISDAQILSAVHALNEDFRKVAGSNGDGLGVDVLVEFELAKRTPDGLPTTGIVRVDGSGVPGFAEHGIASLETLPGADQTEVKALTSWLGDDYLNVFVVPEINGNNGGGGIQGFAYTGPTGDVRDGVTLLYNVIGTEGTLKPGRTLNRTLTHEVGHHLSLFHTFYDTNACGSEVDCVTEGDFVCDTPTTTENASCSVGACPGAQLENYMDYAPTSCRNTFTAGQRQRMRTCLETVRSSLLESLGAVPVVDVDLLPVALNASSVCAPTWHPVLSVQNQGVLPAPGATVHWSVNGIALSPVTFNTPIPAGATIDLALPEKLLIGILTEWTFTVTLPDEANDDFSGNDTLLHTLSYTGDDTWTLTLNTDFFGNESSWAVTDSTGVTLWAGDDYGFGANTYVSSACIPPGCHTLTVEDSGGDGLALGGSLLLQNATGDTLAHIPQGTNFGES
ncbi:MAG: M43 family zinc metalloprotease, partial [Bacteroidota bacterium]|nr:M43 family zinc metalloprotease [Bacteroidota bacterium]